MLRLIRWTSLVLLVLVLIGWGAAWVAARDPDGAAAAGLRRVITALGLEPAASSGTAPAGGVQLGGPFKLVDGNGRVVTDQDFRGKWALIYFGYTYCPDVCPTELQTISAALGLLGEKGRQVVPVFITVDPERDTPATIGQYVKLFDERLVGLTGTPAEIAAVARAYRVYYAKARPKGSDTYLMDHSSFSYLVGPDGRFRSLIRPGLTAEAMAADIEKVIGGD